MSHGGQQQWGHQHSLYQQQQPAHQPQQQYYQQGGWGNQGSWSPGMGQANAGIPGVELTDADIVISTGLEHSRTRESNLEYQKLLLANSVLFGSLPSQYQGVHAQHLYHFLTHVRGRRFLQCIAPNVYVPFSGGPLQIRQEIIGDACKMAFQNRNPTWILDGLAAFTTSHEPPSQHKWAHRPNPRGNDWVIVDIDRVKEIMKEEGLVHLIVLPTGIEIKSVIPIKEELKEGIEGEKEDEMKVSAHKNDERVEKEHDLSTTPGDDDDDALQQQQPEEQQSSKPDKQDPPGVIGGDSHQDEQEKAPIEAGLDNENETDDSTTRITSPNSIYNNEHLDEGSPKRSMTEQDQTPRMKRIRS